MTKSDRLMGSGVFLAPHQGIVAPASQKKLLGAPYLPARTQYEKFYTVIKLDVRKISTRSTTNADARSVCGR